MIYNFLLQTKPYKTFSSYTESGNIPHALLLFDKDGYTAEHTLKLFACAVLCLNEDKPCLKCHNCRRVMDGVHPDCLSFPKNDKVLVGDIDEIIVSSAYRPCEADYKIYLLKGGDTIKPDSQNKLLKTLEEPADSLYIFISAANSVNILPTVKSRCAVIDAPSLTKEQVYGFLSQGKKGDSALEAAAISSGGMLGRAINMYNDKAYINIYNTVYGLFKNLYTADNVLLCMRQISSYKDQPAVLDILALYLRDCLMYKYGRQDLIFDKGAKDIEYAGNYTAKDIIRFIEKTMLAKRMLGLNCNAEATVETLLNDIALSRQNYNGGANIG